MRTMHKPAAGRDESAVQLENGFPTFNSSFGGLEGFQIRMKLVSHQCIFVSDHVWPWPLYLAKRTGESVVKLDKHTPLRLVSSAPGEPLGLVELDQDLNEVLIVQLEQVSHVSCSVALSCMSLVRRPSIPSRHSITYHLLRLWQPFASAIINCVLWTWRRNIRR